MLTTRMHWQGSNFKFDNLELSNPSSKTLGGLL